MNSEECSPGVLGSGNHEIGHGERGSQKMAAGERASSHHQEELPR